MKQRLFVMLIFVLLIAMIVALELQLRYAQIGLQATTEVTNALYFGFTNRHPDWIKAGEGNHRKISTTKS